MLKFCFFVKIAYNLGIVRLGLRVSIIFYFEVGCKSSWTFLPPKKSENKHSHGSLSPANICANRQQCSAYRQQCSHITPRQGEKIKCIPQTFFQYYDRTMTPYNKYWNKIQWRTDYSLHYTTMLQFRAPALRTWISPPIQAGVSMHQV
jgi:hypothetical protein